MSCGLVRNRFIDSGKAGTGKSPDPGAYKLNMTQVLLLEVGR